MMQSVRQCVYPGCTNKRSPSTLKRKSFHRVPSAAADLDRRKLWLTAIQKDIDLPADETEGWTVCSDHFDEDAFFEKEPERDTTAPTKKGYGLRKSKKKTVQRFTRTHIRKDAFPRVAALQQVSNSDGCVSTTCYMHSSLSSAAPWRTDGAIPPKTSTETGYLTLLPVCKEELSSEQQEMTSSLVQVKIEPQIKEEQQEISSSLVQVKLEPQIKEEQQEMSSSLVQVKIEPQIKDEQQEMSPSLVQVKIEPQVKEEQQEELLQRPEEADGSTLILHRLSHGPIYVHQMGYADSWHLPVCKEEVSPEQEERNSSLVQEEPEPPQIKEEQEEELLQRPEEAAVSTQTLLAVKTEDDDSRDTKPVASTSTEHMETQAYIEYCVPSQAGSDDQLLSSHGSESELTDDSDDWEETRGGQTALNKMNSRETDSKSPSTSSQTKKQSFNCKVCGKVCDRMSHLKRHMRTHTGEKPFSCTECDKVFGHTHSLKTHMRTHTGENPLACTECNKVYFCKSALKKHITCVHANHRSKPFSCTECGKALVTQGHLNAHMITHDYPLLVSRDLHRGPRPQNYPSAGVTRLGRNGVLS